MYMYGFSFHVGYLITHSEANVGTNTCAHACMKFGEAGVIYGGFS